MNGRALLAIAVPIIYAVSSGCSSSRAAPQSTWSDALTNLADGSAVYSFRFDGAPPEGAFYNLAVHDASSPADACGRYQSSALETGEFWFLAIDVNDTSLGSHAINLTGRAGAPSATANVTLLHRNAGAYVDTIKAIGGSVDVKSNPNVAETAGGAQFEAVVEADFPSHPSQEVSCQGGSAPNGGDAYQNCTCRADDGTLSTCTPSSPQDINCCATATSDVVHASIRVDAEPCSAMCRWTANLSENYCHDSFGKQ